MLCLEAGLGGQAEAGRACQSCRRRSSLGVVIRARLVVCLGVDCVAFQVDPISLEPLSSLPYEPFELQAKVPPSPPIPSPPLPSPPHTHAPAPASSCPLQTHAPHARARTRAPTNTRTRARMALPTLHVHVRRRLKLSARGRTVQRPSICSTDGCSPRTSSRPVSADTNKHTKTRHRRGNKQTHPPAQARQLGSAAGHSASTLSRSMQRAACNMQRAACNMWQHVATCGNMWQHTMRQATCSMRHVATYNLQRAAQHKCGHCGRRQLREPALARAVRIRRVRRARRIPRAAPP